MDSSTVSSSGILLSLKPEQIWRSTTSSYNLAAFLTLKARRERKKASKLLCREKLWYLQRKSLGQWLRPKSDRGVEEKILAAKDANNTLKSSRNFVR